MFSIQMFDLYLTVFKVVTAMQEAFEVRPWQNTGTKIVPHLDGLVFGEQKTIPPESVIYLYI